MSSCWLNQYCISDWICSLLLFAIYCYLVYRILFFCFQHLFIDNSHILLVIVFTKFLGTPWQDNLRVFRCPCPTFILLLMYLCMYNVLYWRKKLNTIQYNCGRDHKSHRLSEINEAHNEIMCVWQDSQEKQVRKPKQSLSWCCSTSCHHLSRRCCIYLKQ